MVNNLGCGEYNIPLQHFVRTSITKDSFGGSSWIWIPDGNTYFGQVLQTTSEEVDELGRIITKVKATIRIRGWWLPITPLDRLLDLQWNELYFIDSVARGQDEFLCECHSLGVGVPQESDLLQEDLGLLLQEDMSPITI